MYACMHSKLLQSCPTLFHFMNCTYQAPLSMGFSRQECWSGWPFPSPQDLPDPGIKPTSFTSNLHWQASSFLQRHLGSPKHITLSNNLESKKDEYSTFMTKINALSQNRKTIPQNQLFPSFIFLHNMYQHIICLYHSAFLYMSIPYWTVSHGKITIISGSS